MNRILLVFIAAFVSFNALAQMRIKKPNFTSFRTDEQSPVDLLKKLSSPAAQKHPEFGKTPYNAQCVNCVELLDKRTADSRQFVDAYDKEHVYSQKSYFPLHYKKSADDIWRTIDQRLRPTGAGVYQAADQPVPTKVDLNKKTASLKAKGFEFEFNKNLSMYFFDDNTLYTQVQPADYGHYTIGEEGLNVKNIWAGIDMEEIFTIGEIKTNYVISAPLQLPISKGWMVIEDHFTLPEGYVFEESKLGDHLEQGKFFRGDYLLKNPAGETIITYEKPVYLDAKAFGMHGIYKLIRSGNDYTLQTLVPVAWLNKADNTYPLIIDPNVYGSTKLGDFTQSGLPSASMGFTTMALGSCDYHMSVTVPGKSEIVNTLVDVEYTLTYDNACGTPPLPPPFCTFNMVTMEVLSDDCNTTTGLLSCNPAAPPFTGTCTTDSNLVPGANALAFAGLVTSACKTPQCPDYLLNFTLKNRDSQCGDVCGYLCARGNIWRTTVEACQVWGTIVQDKTQVCAGQPVTFTAKPRCGVPPYRYEWLWAGGDSIRAISGTADFVLYPEKPEIVTCNIIDACGVDSMSLNDLNVSIIPTPSADAGSTQPLCEGGQVQLGGNPTTGPGNVISWVGETPTATGWLSNASTANPLVNVPAGTVDTVFFVVKADNGSCFRTDTVNVISVANPVAQVDTSGSTSVCSNQNITISTVGSFSSYLWNNGATTPSINVNNPGNYFVIVADANGCRDTSNSITISAITVPTVNVFPDTIIMYGDSVLLYTDLNLNSAIVDSFSWSPSVYISCTTCPTPVVSPPNDQYYSVVVHASGCTVSDSALIRIILPNNFFIPNAFSPNGDGNNDNFYIQAQSGVRVILFQVFNRLGEKIHEGNFPWDGTYKGKQAPPGVYVYIFKLGLFGDDNALFRKGSVTLFR